ncbi:MAG: TetR/AcrR family transcriptional regulator [Dehalococcoidia bacterium]
MKTELPERVEESTDGRRAWRERNRTAVVDALLDLYQDGIVNPSADEIAACSGVSRRSVFRYFDDLDELCRVAIARQTDRISHLFPIAALGEGGLEERIDALVRQRVRLFDAIAPVARVARMRAPIQPVIAQQLRADGALLRRQLERQFERELANFDEHKRSIVVSAADVLTSFEAYELLVNRQGKSPEEAAAVMRVGLTVLLPR